MWGSQPHTLVSHTFSLIILSRRPMLQSLWHLSIVAYFTVKCWNILKLKQIEWNYKCWGKWLGQSGSDIHTQLLQGRTKHIKQANKHITTSSVRKAKTDWQHKPGEREDAYSTILQTPDVTNREQSGKSYREKVKQTQHKNIKKNQQCPNQI